MFGTILTMLPSILAFMRVSTEVKAVWDSSTGNTLTKVAAVVHNTESVPMLEALGAQLFPKLAPTIHAAAAAVVMAHPNATKWLQSALNAVDNAGLDVDGHYGPLTRAAVEAFQTKNGLHVTGFASDAENTAIMAALNALGG